MINFDEARNDGAELDEALRRTPRGTIDRPRPTTRQQQGRRNLQRRGHSVK